MSRPDILFYNKDRNELIIVEGKIEKDLKLGIAQLSDEHLERFTLLLKTSYPECSIKKALCITIDKIENIQKYNNLEFPILFALDHDGKFYSSF